MKLVRALVLACLLVPSVALGADSYVGVGTQQCGNGATCSAAQAAAGTVLTIAQSSFNGISGLTTGDVLIAVGYSQNISATCTVSGTGWTQKTVSAAASTGSMCFAYAYQSSTPGTLTMTWSTNVVSQGVVTAWRGVATSGDPFDVLGSYTTQATVTAISTGGLTPTASYGAVLRFAGTYVSSSQAGNTTNTSLTNATSAMTWVSVLNSNQYGPGSGNVAREYLGFGYALYSGSRSATGNITSTAQRSATYNSIAFSLKRIVTHATSVTVSPTTSSIVGGTTTSAPTATVLPVDASDLSVAWSKSGAGCNASDTVNASTGVLTAYAGGTYPRDCSAVATATDTTNGTITGSQTVTISDPAAVQVVSGYPVSASNIANTTYPSATVPASGTNRLMVATVTYAGSSSTTVQGPVSGVAGCGLTWTQIRQDQGYNGAAQSFGSAIFAAWVGGVQVSGCGVAPTFGNANGKSVLITVYALQNTADGSTTITNAFGANNGAVVDSAQNDLKTTLTGVAANSYSIWVGMNYANYSGFNGTTGTTLDTHLWDSTVWWSGASGHSLLTGDITIGSDFSAYTWTAQTAVEAKAVGPAGCTTFYSAMGVWGCQ